MSNCREKFFKDGGLREFWDSAVLIDKSLMIKTFFTDKLTTNKSSLTQWIFQRPIRHPSASNRAARAASSDRLTNFFKMASGFKSAESAQSGSQFKSSDEFGVLPDVPPDFIARSSYAEFFALSIDGKPVDPVYDSAGFEWNDATATVMLDDGPQRWSDLRLEHLGDITGAQGSYVPPKSGNNVLIPNEPDSWLNFSTGEETGLHMPNSMGQYITVWYDVLAAAYPTTDPKINRSKFLKERLIFEGMLYAYKSTQHVMANQSRIQAAELTRRCNQLQFGQPFSRPVITTDAAPLYNQNSLIMPTDSESDMEQGRVTPPVVVDNPWIPGNLRNRKKHARARARDITTSDNEDFSRKRPRAGASDSSPDTRRPK
jgi:hypothetical protein